MFHKWYTSKNLKLINVHLFVRPQIYTLLATTSAVLRITTNVNRHKLVLSSLIYFVNSIKRILMEL